MRGCGTPVAGLVAMAGADTECESSILGISAGGGDVERRTFPCGGCRCDVVECDVVESRGSANTHGEPICGSSPGGGVTRSLSFALTLSLSLSLSFAFVGGDLVNLNEPPLPCELLGSSPLFPAILLSISFDRSLSLSLSLSLSRSLSFSSLTSSVLFFLTNPAASNAVVARCIILTLPERAFRPLLPLPPISHPFSFSFSFSRSRSRKLPAGVDGWLLELEYECLELECE